MSARFSLQGRRVLYTGAAGGFGVDTTVALLQAGAHVIALDNHAGHIDRLRSTVPAQLAGQLQILQADLADASALQAHLERLTTEGTIDVVINNAAIYPSRPFEEYSDAELARVHRVNVEAAVQIVRAALPGMREQQWGRVINISSITLSGGWENLLPYVQSKGAMVGVTRAFAREFGKWGITVNAISPGAFPTDAEKIHPDPEGYNRMVLERQSVKRRGHAGDIAAAIVFLASDEAGFISGQTLAVDGGWVMH
ncbi:oxidoreductase [Achromobacter xylosoxidans]|uniref:SDR family NAD(P)-dependent oxidoreductase n=1 Tax=Achromobacter TaxID=222 RepID=UPI0007981D69|nr:SDR family oxidoreductase [Achromobacter mucicolens]KXJ66961.1 oxidoreductase [Achromobacter xylosoxidans]MDH1524443.1 SDR family oxidoreductase [Achromobacter mucicolens]